MKIRLNKIRISFADDIFNAHAAEEGGEMKFNFEGILPPNHPDLPVLEKAIDTAGAEFFKDKWKTLKPKLEAENRLVLRKQPRTNQSGEIYDGYEGMFWVRGSNKKRPLILNANKVALTEQDGVIYSGCYVNAILEVFGHHHAKGGNRVLAEIKGVQYAGPGDAFGGGAPASPDEFDEVEVAEDLS